MLTKRTTLLIGIATLGVFLVSVFFVGVEKLCGGEQHTRCTQSLDDLLILLLLFLPVLIFSLVTFRMRDVVYESWFRFVRFAVPLSIFMVAITPTYSSDWLFPIEKGSVALATMTFFTLVSIVIIVRKSSAR